MTPPDWLTEPHAEKLAIVRDLTMAGKSTSQIAAHFSNATKNAIISFRLRHCGSMFKGGMAEMQSYGAAAQAEARKKAGQTAAAKNRHAREQRAKARKAKENKAAPIMTPEPTSLPIRTYDLTHAVPLLEAESSQCRWPMWDRITGDVRDLKVCGAPTVSGSSYCPCHKAMSIGKGSESERTAINVAKRLAS